MIVISFLKDPSVESIYTFFIITTFVTIVRSTAKKAIYLHLVHNAFILTFPLKGASGFINAIAFRGAQHVAYS